jgi:hypothetical protein
LPPTIIEVPTKAASATRSHRPACIIGARHAEAMVLGQLDNRTRTGHVAKSKFFDLDILKAKARQILMQIYSPLQFGARIME